MLLAAAVLLASSCGKDKARVIPRAKMAKIYAEMFVMDQWIQNKPGLRTIADTSLVYEPILEKYGYDSDDYQYSVEHYMDDPERFSRILRSTAALLDKELRVLRKLQHEIKLNEKRKKEIENFETDIFQFFVEYVTEDGIRDLSETVDVAWDSTYNAYRFTRLPRTDTIFEGPRMTVKDTVAIGDTLSVKDTLAVTESLAVPDTLVSPASVNQPLRDDDSDSMMVSDTSLKTIPLLNTSDEVNRDTLIRKLDQKGMLKRQVGRPVRSGRIKEDK